MQKIKNMKTVNVSLQFLNTLQRVNQRMKCSSFYKKLVSWIQVQSMANDKFST
jgi:hypothetical protein